MKKARHFEQWYSTSNKPCVLFTDWREVKQCIEAYPARHTEGRPLLTIVFCIDAKQQVRAGKWVSSLGERKDPIYINDGLSTAESTLKSFLPLVVEALGKARDPALSADRCATPPTHEQEQLGFQFVHRMDNDVQGPHHNAVKNQDVASLPFQSAHPEDGVPIHPLSHVVQPGQNVLINSALSVPVRVAQPATHLHHSRVAAHVACIWESFACPAELEEALLAAMPESYEE